MRSSDKVQYDEALIDKKVINEELNEEILIDPEDKKKCSRNVIAFFMLGLLNNYSYVIMFSAAEDLIPHRTGIVGLANIIPTLLIDNFAPFFMEKIAYPIRVIFVVVCAIIAFLSVALIEEQYLKLVGVAFASISSGFGEITFLSLSAFYQSNTVAGWSSGTGGAGIFGSLSYLFLRSILGLSSKVALLIVAPLPLIMLVNYFFLLTKRKTNIVKKADYIELSLKQKISFLPKMPKFMAALFLVYFAEYLINQGLTSSLTFNSPEFLKAASTQYMTYQCLYQTGVFISRSSVSLFQIKKILIPAILQCVTFVFLLFAAYYQFISTIWVIFLIILWEGLLGGATYVNVFHLLRTEIDPQYKEFAMGVASAGTSLGISLSQLCAVFLEPWLCSHHVSAPWGYPTCQ